MEKDFYKGKQEEQEEKEQKKEEQEQGQKKGEEGIKEKKNKQEGGGEQEQKKEIEEEDEEKAKKQKKKHLLKYISIYLLLIFLLVFSISIAGCNNFRRIVYIKITKIFQRNVPTPTPTCSPSPTPSYYEKKWASHMKLLRNIVLIFNSSYEIKESLNTEHMVLFKFIELFSINRNTNIEETDSEKIMNTLIDNLKNGYDIPYPEVYIYLYNHRLLDTEDKKNIKEKAYEIIEDIKNYKLKEQKLKDLLENLIKILNRNIKSLNEKIEKKVKENNISYFDKIKRNYLLKEISIGTDFEEDIKNLLWFLDPDELVLSGERWSEDIPENEYYKNMKEYFVKLKESIQRAVSLIY